MTTNVLMNYKPVTTSDGRVIIEESLFAELWAGYVRERIAEDIRESRQQIKEGKVFPAEEVFAELRAKYGY